MKQSSFKNGYLGSNPSQSGWHKRCTTIGCTEPSGQRGSVHPPVAHPGLKRTGKVGWGKVRGGSREDWGDSGRNLKQFGDGRSMDRGGSSVHLIPFPGQTHLLTLLGLIPTEGLLWVSGDPLIAKWPIGRQVLYKIFLPLPGHLVDPPLVVLHATEQGIYKAGGKIGLPFT